jgi:hypothetical protein
VLFCSPYIRRRHHDHGHIDGCPMHETTHLLLPGWQLVEGTSEHPWPLGKGRGTFEAAQYLLESGQ